MRDAARLLGRRGIATTGFASPPCRIEIVEQVDGWPVPGVELRTVHGVRLISGSPVIHFESTAATSFSDNQPPTPRWDYDQVLYQVDFSLPPFAKGK